MSLEEAIKVEKYGVEKLKGTAKLINAFADVLKAAKEDDNELTWTDLFDRDVWDKGLDLASLSADMVEDWDQLEKELGDLSAAECLELCQAYFMACKSFWHEVKK